MEKQAGNYRYNDISNEEMAAYFERALNSEKFKGIIASAPNLVKAEQYYERAAKMVMVYVMATGDLSATAQDKILDDFALYKNECEAPLDNKTKLSGDEQYFANHILPEVIMYHQNRLNGTASAENIIGSIYIQVQNTNFETHSFNGVLVNDVKSQGFDISKEKFREEFDILRSIGMFQSYKTGVLCTCELSKDTFSYARRCPERLYRTLSISSQRKDDESMRDYLRAGFEEELNKRSDLDENTKAKARGAGCKIIDFYATGEGTKSAIAFIKQDRNIVAEMPKRVMEGIESDSKAQRLDVVLTRNICESFARGFYASYADGYVIKGGKLAPDKFAVATFDNPEEYYTRENRIKKKVNAAASDKQFQDLLMENGEPRLPESWTYLIHGTQKSRWDENAIGQDFVVKGGALSCIDKNDAENDKKGIGLYDTTKTYQGTDNPFQVRVVYLDNPRCSEAMRERLATADLDANVIKDVKRCYMFQGGRHPGIPHNTKLLRVSQTMTENNVPIYWYVPENMLSLYRSDVASMLEKEQKMIDNIKDFKDAVQVLKEYQLTDEQKGAIVHKMEKLAGQYALPSYAERMMKKIKELAEPSDKKTNTDVTIQSSHTR